MDNESIKTPEISIDLRIHSLNQLFESLDPSPFREKATAASGRQSGNANYQTPSAVAL